jgi:hypothetical protein
MLAAFKVPADPNLEALLSRLTQKAVLAGLQPPDRAPPRSPDDLIDSAALQRQALLKLLGTSAPTPDKSPGRLSSLKMARPANAPPRKALEFDAELPDAPLGSGDASDLEETPLITTVKPAPRRASSAPSVDHPPSKPAAQGGTEATFNPSQRRAFTRVSVSAWCLPIECSPTLRQHDQTTLAANPDRTSLRHQRRRTPRSRLDSIVRVSSNSPSASHSLRWLI